MAGSDESAARLPLPGVALRKARTERGLTLEEVAAATRIPLRSLVALEADDYARLPAAVYVRGYLRLCGGLLGLDPEPLMDDFEMQLRAHRGAPDPPMIAGRRRPLLLGIGALAALAALVAGVMMAWSR
ncbi:MAG: helix-turn-helix domain-containing protein [Pseudomonadota bacterium]